MKEKNWHGWERYVAKGGTRFLYQSDMEPDSLVAVTGERNEDAMVPIADVVEFIEVAYHGSEIPVGGRE
jgi:hypothetical protein